MYNFNFIISKKDAKLFVHLQLLEAKQISIFLLIENSDYLRNRKKVCAFCLVMSPQGTKKEERANWPAITKVFTRLWIRRAIAESPTNIDITIGEACNFAVKVRHWKKNFADVITLLGETM